MKELLSRKMIKALLFNCLMDWKVLLLAVTWQKKMVRAISADEIAQFMVIEFDRNEKNIVLSHTRIWEQAKEEEKNAELKEKRAEAEVTKKAVKNIQSKVEKTTLGDLGVLADLKKKMDTEGDTVADKHATKEPVEIESKKASAPIEEIKQAGYEGSAVPDKTSTKEPVEIESKKASTPIEEIKQAGYEAGAVADKTSTKEPVEIESKKASAPIEEIKQAGYEAGAVPDKTSIKEPVEIESKKPALP